MTRARATRAAVLLAALHGGPALAGQLIIEDYGVADAGAAYEATVLKVGPKQAIELQIDRAFGPQATLPPGARVKASLYAGVEWKDPHKSPIDRRLRGATGPGKPGSKTIAVPHDGNPSVFELLAHTDPNLRKVSVLLDPAARAAYPSTPIAQLEADLEDPDLGPHAYAALAAKGAVPPRVIVRADREVLEAHYAALDLAGKRRFLEALAPQAKDEATRTRVLDLVQRHPLAVTPLDALLPFVDVLEPERKPDAREIGDLRISMITASHAEEKADLSPLAGFYGRFLARRPSHVSDEKELRDIAARMDAKAKVVLARILLENVHARGEVDHFLLAGATQLALEAPDPALLDPLATLDPMRARVTSTREAITGAALTIAAAIAEKSPRDAEKALLVAGPLLEHRAPVPDEVAARFRAATKGATPAPPRAAELTLEKGAARYLPGGLRVAYLGDGISIHTRSDSGRTSTIDPSGVWYREGYEEPWTWTAEPAGPTGVKISVEPVKRELKEEPELQKIAERAGCGDPERTQLEAWNGVYIHETARCTVLVGAFTGRLARVERKK